jgi:hypothetical protein
MTGASVFLRFFYAGGMRQSTLLKILMIFVGVAAAGGAVVGDVESCAKASAKERPVFPVEPREY